LRKICRAEPASEQRRHASASSAPPVTAIRGTSSLAGARHGRHTAVQIDVVERSVLVRVRRTSKPT
jgi:hypothetical protein